jgi:hypothetical protein
MARFETRARSEEASLFDSVLWAFLARMLGCSVPVNVVRRCPEADGERWIVEMDDEYHLQELTLEAEKRRAK